MNMLNKIFLEGEMSRLTINKKSVKPHCIIEILNYRESVKDNGYVEENQYFFDIECFGTQAEKAVENYRDGGLVRVFGKMKPVYWKDLEGKKQSRMQIICEHLEFDNVR